jgi:hypothetical protein
MGRQALADFEGNQILIDLSKPDDEWLLRIMLDGHKWRGIIEDLDRDYLRPMEKWWDDEKFKKEGLDYKTVVYIRDKLYELMKEENLALHE